MPEQLGLTNSTLPFFDHAHAGEGLESYICSRCKGQFLTLKPLEAPTAPCPHCFKVSQVPA